MPTKQDIDFHQVSPEHHEIDRRLKNWAVWCRGSLSPSISPMFRMVRSAARARGAESTWATFAVDRMDAQRVQKAVTHLPEKHRAAIQWAYVKPVNPRRAASDIGVTLDGLADLLWAGRQMLVNRGV